METVTGTNIRHILTDAGQDDVFKMKKSDMRNKVNFPIEHQNEWKVAFVREITDVQKNVLNIEADENGQFTDDELREILNFVTTV